MTEASPCPAFGYLCEYVPMAHQVSSLRGKMERLRAALEWALDHATSDHHHYPYREGDKWTFPYLVSNAGGFGGGVGNAYFPTALEAVEAAIASAALGEPTPQPMEKVKDGGGYTSMSDIQMPQGTITDDTMVEIRGGWVVPWAVADEIERLRAALKAVEWRCVGDNGETYCPVCNATEEEGHKPSCAVLAALHPAPIQGEKGVLDAHQG